MADTPEAVGGLVPASAPDIKNLIYTVRGQQVMLDSDLARLYGVETGALNRAAKRNEERCHLIFDLSVRPRLTRT